MEGLGREGGKGWARSYWSEAPAAGGATNGLGVRRGRGGGLEFGVVAVEEDEGGGDDHGEDDGCGGWEEEDVPVLEEEGKGVHGFPFGLCN